MQYRYGRLSSAKPRPIVGGTYGIAEIMEFVKKPRFSVPGSSGGIVKGYSDSSNLNKPRKLPAGLHLRKFLNQRGSRDPFTTRMVFAIPVGWWEFCASLGLGGGGGGVLSSLEGHVVACGVQRAKYRSATLNQDYPGKRDQISSLSNAIGARR